MAEAGWTPPDLAPMDLIERDFGRHLEDMVTGCRTDTLTPRVAGAGQMSLLAEVSLRWRRM